MNISFLFQNPHPDLGCLPYGQGAARFYIVRVTRPQGKASTLVGASGCVRAGAQRRGHNDTGVSWLAANTDRARRAAKPAEESACPTDFNPLFRTLRRIPREGASAGSSSLGT